MNTGREKGEESSVIVSLQTDACDCHNREGCRERSRRQGEERKAKREREERRDKREIRGQQRAVSREQQKSTREMYNFRSHCSSNFYALRSERGALRQYGI